MGAVDLQADMYSDTRQSVAKAELMTILARDALVGLKGCHLVYDAYDVTQ